MSRQSNPPSQLHHAPSPQPHALRLPLPRANRYKVNSPLWLVVLRSLVFLFLFNLTILVQGLLGLPMLLMPKALSQPYALSWIRMQFWLLYWICGLDYRVIGIENLPSDNAVILASKHQSAWDTIAFLDFAYDPVYVLKRELFHIPIYGWWCVKMGMVGINRKGRSSSLRALLQDSKRVIDAGQRLVIFPQGTRTAAGSGKAYQSGIYAIYRECKVAVVPVALNSGDYWPKRSVLRYPGCITISLLPPIPPGLPREEFMETLESSIETMSLKLAKRQTTHQL